MDYYRTQCSFRELLECSDDISVILREELAENDGKFKDGIRHFEMVRTHNYLNFPKLFFPLFFSLVQKATVSPLPSSPSECLC